VKNYLLLILFLLEYYNLNTIYFNTIIINYWFI